MRYDLSRGEGLNFGKGRCIPLQPFVSKGKPANYYDQTRRGLGYVTPPTTFDSEVESDYSPLLHSSESSNWDSDVTVIAVFKDHSLNMTSICRRKECQDTKVEPFNSDPWAQQLNYEWKMCFE